jgi:hypothetical protein
MREWFSVLDRQEQVVIAKITLDDRALSTFRLVKRGGEVISCDRR